MSRAIMCAGYAVVRGGTSAKSGTFVNVILTNQSGGVASEWQRIERLTDRPRLAASWIWTETWLRHFGGVVPHYFAIGERDGDVVGTALVTRSNERHGPIPLRTLHLGTAGEPPGESVYVEYNDVLSLPECRPAFARELLQRVTSTKGWDVLRLDAFAPDAAVFAAGGPDRFDVRDEVCWTTDLVRIRDGDGELASILSKKVRAKLRANLRRVEQEHGSLTTEWAESPAQAVDILTELARLHEARWGRVQRPGAFASERFSRFHLELAGRLLPEGKAYLFRVRAGDRTIGCKYGFIENGSALFYQWGLAPFEGTRLSPGYIVSALCVEACAQRGLFTYNWLAGDAPYKRELSTGEDRVLWGELARGPRPVALRALRRVARGRRRARQVRTAT